MSSAWLLERYFSLKWCGISSAARGGHVTGTAGSGNRELNGTAGVMISLLLHLQVKSVCGWKCLSLNWTNFIDFTDLNGDLTGTESKLTYLPIRFQGNQIPQEFRTFQVGISIHLSPTCLWLRRQYPLLPHCSVSFYLLIVFPLLICRNHWTQTFSVFVACFQKPIPKIFHIWFKQER